MTNSLNVKVTVYTSEMEQTRALIGLFVCLGWALLPLQTPSPCSWIPHTCLWSRRWFTRRGWGANLGEAKQSQAKCRGSARKLFTQNLTCLCWKRGESFASGPCSCQSHPKSDGEKQSWGMPRAAQTPQPAWGRGAKWGAGLHASTLEWHAFLIKEIWMEEQLAWAHFLHVFRLCKRNKWPKHLCLHL